MKICNNCGHSNPSEHNYCTRCGVKLDLYQEFRASLIMLSGNQNKAIYQLSQTDNFIGRSIENSIVVGDDKVSKNHALINYDGERYWISDLKSRNGVYVNGKKIEGKEALSDGAIIKMGSTIFKFQTS
jgi:pSer/pThr/pTyr-binding forkhead associated (FHA) protein